MVSVCVITVDHNIAAYMIMCNLFSHDTHLNLCANIDECWRSFHFYQQLLDNGFLQNAFINHNAILRPTDLTWMPYGAVVAQAQCIYRYGYGYVMDSL